MGTPLEELRGHDADFAVPRPPLLQRRRLRYGTEVAWRGRGGLTMKRPGTLSAWAAVSTMVMACEAPVDEGPGVESGLAPPALSPGGEPGAAVSIPGAALLAKARMYVN